MYQRSFYKTHTKTKISEKILDRKKIKQTISLEGRKGYTISHDPSF